MLFTGLAAASGSPAGVALLAGPIANQGKVATLGTGIAFISDHLGNISCGWF